MKRINCAQLSVILFILLVLITETGNANTFFMRRQPSSKMIVGVRFLQCDFKPSLRLNDKSLLTGSYDFYAKVPIKGGLNLVAIFPITYTSSNDDMILTDALGNPIGRREMDGTYVNNIYFGMQIRSFTNEKAKTSISLGLYLPTEKEDIDKYNVLREGWNANRHDYYRHYAAWTIYSNFSLLVQNYDFYWGFEFGPHFVIPDRKDYSSALYIHYGIVTGFDLNSVNISGELIGLQEITDRSEFHTYSLNSLVLGGTLTKYSFQPSVFYQIPLRDYIQDTLNGVIGVRLEYIFPK